ncbi:PilZ domain-containing protein [Motiliproteus sediminis]|uniref:PilZ domain-containing protein n=1 Tax=Motiliproteus sediminis TaxID=1468178 RepID=UPI001AEF849E|nr:PilZ domain-containing protein [Motiliproteus sediminis]
MSEADRRHTFRMPDRATVELKKMTSTEQSLTALFPPSTYDQLLQQLWLTDQEIDRQLRRLEEQERSVGHCLRLFSQKLELLAQAACRSDTDQKTLAIDLSEGGFSLQTDTPLSIGTRYALRLRLQPRGIPLVCHTEVVYSHSGSDGKMRHGFRFVDLSEQQRLMLIRHLFQLQAEARRQQHEANA